MLRSLYATNKDFHGFSCCKSFHSAKDNEVVPWYNKVVWVSSITFFPWVYCFVSVFQVCEISLCTCRDFGDGLDNVELTKLDGRRNSDEKFSMTGFCIAFWCGWLVVGSVGLIVSAFFTLPLPTISLAGYLENILQIFLVTLAALVSYKVLSINESDLSKFLSNFRKGYKKNGEDARLVGDTFETSGVIAGDVAKAVKLISDNLVRCRDDIRIMARHCGKFSVQYTAQEMLLGQFISLASACNIVA